MENKRENQCANCAELWKRIDKLTEEKAQRQKLQGAQLTVSIGLLILIVVSFMINLLK